MKVLVFEPEEDIRKSLVEILEENKIKVHIAETVDEIENHIGINRYNALIFPFYQNNDHVLEYLDKIKDLKLKIPSIALGHFPDSRFYNLLAQKGCFLTLKVPFEKSEFEALIKKFILIPGKPLDFILEVITNISGIHLTLNNQNSLLSRVDKRMRALAFDNAEKYFKYFQIKTIEEINYLISTLTTHTTSFFREASHFDFLYEKGFVSLLMEGRPLRIWSAGCSSGEELYSLAISFLEYCEHFKVPQYIVDGTEFFGTDIDVQSLKKAKNGIYLKEDIDGINPSLIKKYFDSGDGDFEPYLRVKNEVHKLCKFSENNLLSDNYLTGEYDIIFLRHTLIYFKEKQAENVLNKIQERIVKDGLFFISFSEGNFESYLKIKMVSPSIFKNMVVEKLSEEISPIDGTDYNLETEEKEDSEERPTVLIVDDSKYIRKKLKEIFEEDGIFEIIGEAENPVEAMPIINQKRVDLVTLDINMPVMDGLTYLDQVKRKKEPHPPVILISSVDIDTAEKFFKTGDLPYFDFLEKPSNDKWDSFKTKLLEIGKSAILGSNPTNRIFNNVQYPAISFKGTKEENCAIVLGSSTGGVDALTAILPQFPTNSPPLVIAQHMPPMFTAAFAERMNTRSRLNIHEAREGDELREGHAYICPGGLHIKLVKLGKSIVINLVKNDSAPFIPSINILMESCLELTFEHKIIGIILTGMGDDGALGMRKLKENGAYTLAQDKDSSVVYGMPKKALEFGGVSQVAPLYKVVAYVFKNLEEYDKKAA